jgi:hypothetical protein
MACSMDYKVLFTGMFYDDSLFRDCFADFRSDSMCAKFL